MAFKRSVFLFLLVVSSAFLGVEIARGQVILCKLMFWVGVLPI